MVHIPVQSTTLASVGYGMDRSLLEVRFQDGGLYRFQDVPPHYFEELLAARSKGAYFNTHIRKHFDYQRVDEPPSAPEKTK